MTPAMKRRADAIHVDPPTDTATKGKEHTVSNTSIATPEPDPPPSRLLTDAELLEYLQLSFQRQALDDDERHGRHAPGAEERQRSVGQLRAVRGYEPWTAGQFVPQHRAAIEPPTVEIEPVRNLARGVTAEQLRTSDGPHRPQAGDFR